MSLFIASIGLALVLRHVLFLVAGAEPRELRRRPVQGLRRRQRPALAAARSSRSSSPPSRSCSSRSLLARTALGRTMRARRRRPRARRRRGHRTSTASSSTPGSWPARSRASAGVLHGLVQRTFTRTSASRSCCRSSPRSCSAASAARTARSPAACCSAWRRSSRPGRASRGGVDPVYKPVVAFVRPDRRPARPPAGPLREGARPYERRSRAASSGPSSASSPGSTRSSRSASSCSSASPGCSTSATSRSWRSAPTRWRSSIVKTGLEHVARGAARDRRRRGRVRPPPRPADAAPARRLLRDHDDRVQRDRPLRRDQRGPASPAARRARSTSPAPARPPHYNGEWERFQRAVQDWLACSTSARRTSTCS